MGKQGKKQITPSRQGRDGQEEDGAAMPCHKAMAKQPKRCLVEVAGSEGLVLWPKALPIDSIIRMVSCEVLNGFGIIGRAGWCRWREMKSTTTGWHSERWLVSFLLTPMSRAYPGVQAALDRVYFWSGEMICTSRAAGRP